jgi:hypothetical protein
MALAKWSLSFAILSYNGQREVVALRKVTSAGSMRYDPWIKRLSAGLLKSDHQRYDDALRALVVLFEGAVNHLKSRSRDGHTVPWSVLGVSKRLSVSKTPRRPNHGRGAGRGAGPHLRHSPHGGFQP